jgi:pimeloyl-ACP methyl ester carboxylesterase
MFEKISSYLSSWRWSADIDTCWPRSVFFIVCSPPPKPVATLFGRGLLWYLRPRIQSICINLYPTNPAAVDTNLCESIRRDSLDPGAIAVMISGSKLPPPRTANELLGADFGSSKDGAATVKEGKWNGPVLVAQGMKDPLNDAVGRAGMFESLRPNISVEALDGGHCPHVSCLRDVCASFVRC